MKKFKSDDEIDCCIFKEGEIIKFEDRYLRIKIFEKVNNPCEECFFKNEKYHYGCGWNINCNVYTAPDEYGNQEIDYEVIYEELSEIEVLVLLGDKNEKV